MAYTSPLLLLLLLLLITSKVDRFDTCTERVIRIGRLSTDESGTATHNSTVSVRVGSVGKQFEQHRSAKKQGKILANPQNTVFFL